MAENIFIFVPNLIGYGRIILALLSFYYMPTNHIMAASMYILSGFLDAFDGHAARALNQATKFGAMLDMLTDRCGTMCLLVTLSHFYPQYMFLFQVSMTIDISCHWLHLHTTLLAGRKSHKGEDSNTNPILRIYYTSKVVLFFMCAGNELFYSSLYLLHFTEGPIIAGVGLWRILSYGLLPVGVLKSVLALMQGYSAALSLGEIDVLERQESQKTK
ncbi:CDP-diacylglycerol--inositol 3-phosphatidyltransferase-like [Portunus trituberculatus]|uniref:CDP-diacylglycerol--inositol 3-phosphatidyltransferase n=1 Tax=Portunus trituberculatus TaxID=210409 RepID=A0A5B7GVF7_PORTR|nr:CDP-diacylglycerol--inositol 3-phosphatidyltransferase-like [Portunus trituberculatus]MPC60544.1 CDP-diacylglycerol--inositol 3-phosphatidyltransferase [Portunus trituberculatus]